MNTNIFSMLPSAELASGVAPEEEDFDPGFVIDDDGKADWALRRIKEEKDEYIRLSTLADEQKSELDYRVEQARKRYEGRTGFLRDKLMEYFHTVPHRSTKTQEKYQLLSGALVLKKGGTHIDHDDDALSVWMLANGYQDMVKTTHKPQWGTFKRCLSADPDTGIVTLTDTGEIVEGLTASVKEDTFDIKF